MTPAGWSPVDQALAHAATIPDTQHRVIDARDRLAARARQRYADALKATKRRHPTRGAWTVAQVAAVNAAEWRDRGYPTGGDGGRSSTSSETWCFTHERAAGRCPPSAACEVESLAPSSDRLADMALGHDEASTVFWRAHTHAHAAMQAIARDQWPGVYNALCDLQAVMEEAAGLAPMPAPDGLNTTDPSCENHAKAGKWAAPSVKRAGLLVCRYCYDAHRDTGQWPDTAWLSAADRNDQRTIRRLRTAAMLLTEEETKGGLIDVATGRVRSKGMAEMHGPTGPAPGAQRIRPHDLTPPHPID